MLLLKSWLQAVAQPEHSQCQGTTWHTTFASSLIPRPRPAFSCLQYGNAEFLSFLCRSILGPYRRLELEHFDHAFATNLRARSVRSLGHLYIIVELYPPLFHLYVHCTCSRLVSFIIYCPGHVLCLRNLLEHSSFLFKVSVIVTCQSQFQFDCHCNEDNIPPTCDAHHVRHLTTVRERAQHIQSLQDLQQTCIATLRSGEHTRPRFSEAILHSLISTPLCTFSAQFAIDNGTFGTDNFQERLHWWGTASNCQGTCPSVPQLGYASVWL